MTDLTKDATLPRRRLNADAVAGAITLIVGVALTVVALGIQPSSFGNAVLQPRDLPLACGVGLVLAGAVLSVQGLRKTFLPAVVAVGPESEPVVADIPEGAAVLDAHEGPTGAAVTAPHGDESPVVDDAADAPENKRNVLALGLLLFGYVATFIPLGYVVSTMAFLFIGSMYFSPGKLRRNALFSVLLSVGVYLLFTELLGIVLPQGILEPIL